MPLSILLYDICLRYFNAVFDVVKQLHLSYTSYSFGEDLSRVPIQPDFTLAYDDLVDWLSSIRLAV